MDQQRVPYERRAHYYETDRMGVIHHSNYIRWFEEARVDFLDRIGLPYAGFEAAGILIPVLGITCEYRSSVVFDERIEVRVRMSQLSSVKMTIEYDVVSAGSGILKATGQSRHCFTDKAMRPVRLQREYPDVYEKLALHLEK